MRYQLLAGLFASITIIAGAGCTLLGECGSDREYCVGDACACGEACTKASTCGDSGVCAPYGDATNHGVCVPNEFAEEHDVRGIDDEKTDGRNNRPSGRICTFDADCDPGEACEGEQCILVCASSADCSSGTACLIGVNTDQRICRDVLAGEEPALQFDGAGVVELTAPPDVDRTQAQQSLVVRNAGAAPLRLTRVAWIDKPTRLEAVGTEGGFCQSDQDCRGTSICRTASMTCVSTELPEQVVIDPNIRFDLDFVVTRGDADLGCLPPTIEVPEHVGPNYCGSLQIETNATNDGDWFAGGTATVYFTYDGPRGLASIAPAALSFDDPQPGSTAAQSFAVTNEGTGTLIVERWTIADDPGYFDVRPTNAETFPIFIAAGEAHVFDLDLTIPVQDPDYAVDTVLSLESSAGPIQLAVSVTAD